MNTRVLAKTKASVSSTPPMRGKPLQGKCACRGTLGPSGERDECRKNKFRLLPTQRDMSKIAPPIRTQMDDPHRVRFDKYVADNAKEIETATDSSSQKDMLPLFHRLSKFAGGSSK